VVSIACACSVSRERDRAGAGVVRASLTRCGLVIVPENKIENQYLHSLARDILYGCVSTFVWLVDKQTGQEEMGGVVVDEGSLSHLHKDINLAVH
jgi:hypothetical protein